MGVSLPPKISQATSCDTGAQLALAAARYQAPRVAVVKVTLQPDHISRGQFQKDDQGGGAYDLDCSQPLMSSGLILSPRFRSLRFTFCSPVIYRITSFSKYHFRNCRQKLKGSQLLVHLVSDTPVPFMTRINARCSPRVLRHPIPS